MGTFDGTLTTIRAHERGKDGTPNPTYRCLFPEPPPPGTVPTCAEAGVLGAMAGMLGSMMALEVIREIVGFGDGLVGRLVMIDTRSMRFETLRYSWDPANPLSGSQATIRDLSIHAAPAAERGRSLLRKEVLDLHLLLGGFAAPARRSRWMIAGSSMLR